MKTTSWARLLLALPLLAVSPMASEPGPSTTGATAAEGRVIVLGFDGADARTVRQLVAERPQDYPTFARLEREGSFEPLIAVAPPESPVSWAALNTGQNPAKTGVPGFVKRNLSGGRPTPGLGHLDSEDAEVARFSNTPIPNWSAGTYQLVGGAAAFLVVLLLFLALTRKAVVALVLGLVAGAGGVWGGTKLRSYLPEKAPRTTNPNQARNFWDFAGDAGVRCVVLDPAQAFDMPTPPSVDLLAGLGIPDARGGIGEWFLYTSDPQEFSYPPKGRKDGLTAGTVFKVDQYDGVVETRIFGPRNFWLEERLQRQLDEVKEKQKGAVSFDEGVELNRRQSELSDQLSKAKLERTGVDMVVRKDGDGALVTIGGQEQRVREGEWSDFFELDFAMNPVLSAKAITRVRLVHVDDPFFHMFVNVLDIDPRSPPFWQAISSPFSYSKQLADACGLYETYGWPTATMPFKDGLIEPEVLLEDVQFTMAWRERLTYDQLARDDWRIFMSVFSTTDRVQHMMYRYYDEGHPRYDAAEAAHEVTFFGERIPLSEAIPVIYKQMDRIIGKVLDEFVEPGDTFLVCSDHGFQSFRRQVHVNNVLAELGYLTLKPLASKKDGDVLSFVDWDNTRAYSLGMGFIYLNLEGRESRGTVKPSEATALLRQIREDFLKVRDPENGEPVCNDAYITAEVHSGPHIDLEGDMLLGFAPTYRVSWASTFGGLAVEEDELGGYRAAPVCSDNDSLWSGGHVSVALPDVAGVFFSNRKLAPGDRPVQALAVAPTVLELAGVAVPGEMDLEPLRFER